MAKDALAVALAGYVLEQWDIPVPSPVAEGQELVPVPPVIAAKLALYTAMRSQRGVGRSAEDLTLGDRW